MEFAIFLRLLLFSTPIVGRHLIFNITYLRNKKIHVDTWWKTICEASSDVKILNFLLTVNVFSVYFFISH
jgi:hypothetical protein